MILDLTDITVALQSRLDRATELCSIGQLGPGQELAVGVHSVTSLLLENLSLDSPERTTLSRLRKRANRLLLSHLD